MSSRAWNAVDFAVSGRIAPAYLGMLEGCVKVRCSATCASKNASPLQRTVRHLKRENEKEHVPLKMQCVAVGCNVLQCVAVCCSVTRASENASPLQRTVRHFNRENEETHMLLEMRHHCNTLQHTATHCNTLATDFSKKPSWYRMVKKKRNNTYKEVGERETQHTHIWSEREKETKERKGQREIYRQREREQG